MTLLILTSEQNLGAGMHLPAEKESTILWFGGLVTFGKVITGMLKSAVFWSVCLLHGIVHFVKINLYLQLWFVHFFTCDIHIYMWYTYNMYVILQ